MLDSLDIGASALNAQLRRCLMALSETVTIDRRKEARNLGKKGSQHC